MRETILELLRERTRHLHDRIERRVDVMGESLTPERYRRLLAGFYGFYAPLEPRLASFREWVGCGVDPARRAKVQLLAKDLAVLGYTREELPHLPRCSQLPPLPSFASALGCGYVLEGATLGGQVIGRRLRGTLGLSPGAGAAFFNSYGSCVGPMWRSYLRGLVGFPLDVLGRTHAVEGAAETFCRLEAWLEGAGALVERAERTDDEDSP